MRKLIPALALSLVLLVAPVTPLVAQNPATPAWVRELRIDACRTFSTPVEMARFREKDRLEEREFAVIRLTGEGSLEKVPDPIEEMRTLFLSRGWQEVPRYAADGHGSASGGYRKGALFCIGSVQIDSSCDDEETGHVPSLFQFSIDCRE